MVTRTRVDAPARRPLVETPVETPKPARRPAAKTASRKKLAKVVGQEAKTPTDRATKATRLPQVAVAVLGTNPPSPSPLFQSRTVLPLTLSLPLAELIAAKEAWVAADKQGEKPAIRSGRVQLPEGEAEVRLKIRGNSSLAAYTWPKLGLRLPDEVPPALRGLKSVNLINHTFADFDEVSHRLPWREATAYAVLESMGIPTLKARAAQVRYQDDSPGPGRLKAQSHPALLVEDDKDAAVRYGGVSVDLAALHVIEPPVVLPMKDVLRLELAQRLLGNRDFQLFYEADGPKNAKVTSVWNFDAIELPAGPGGQRRAQLLASDFDRTNWVSMPLHFNAGEVFAWIEQAYWNHPKPTLEAITSILGTKPAVLKTIKELPLDDEAKAQLPLRAKAYFDLLAKFLKKPTPKPE